jgi:hypothetical protein
MTPLFKKLNLGTHTAICVLNAPTSFEGELAALTGVTIDRTHARNVRFAIAFAVTKRDLDALSAKLVKGAVEDAIVWIAYPKGSSKQYRCEFNRDSGWDVLGAAGFEPVRMVAIDNDWSALRFRRVEHIATMTRSAAGAISAAGKRRTSKA